MKVGINGYNKPLPISELALAGIIAGGASIAGAGIQAGANAYKNKKSWQRRKEEIGILEGNADENATLAYERQKELIEGERAYNDPSAVAARYRAAGINPRAALQGAASGAGISHSSDNAPLSSPNSAGYTMEAPDIGSYISNAGALVATELRNNRIADSEIAKNNAETTEQLIENEYKEQNLVADLLIKRGQYEKLLTDKSLSESQRKHYEKLIEGVDQQIAESQERTKGYEVQRDNVSAQSANTRANTARTQTETKREQNKLDFEEKFNGAPMELLNSLPGSAAFISYAVTKQVESGVAGLREFVENVQHNPRRFPDPVGDFVRANWPKLRDWLNEIDRKFTNGRAKPL